MKLYRKLAFLAIIALLVRGLVALGAETALDSFLQFAIQDEEIVAGAVFGQSPLLSSAAQSLSFVEYREEETYSENQEDDIIENTPIEFLPPIQMPEGDTRPAQTFPDLAFSGWDRPSASALELRNHTTHAVNIEQLFDAPLRFDLSNNGNPTVLILHTHGTESFTPDGFDWYDNTDNYRSNDTRLNIIRVGEEVAAVLESRGINVIHSRQIHDYPSFRGSYGRSLTAAQEYLARYPEIDVIFDIHRDAMMDNSGNYIRTLANVAEQDTAQVMLVVGTDHAGLYHPGWRDNLGFALQLQGEMVGFHPTFARPISLREERFNHHLTPGSVLVEIGKNTNTLQEALAAGRIFAQLAANVILGEEH